MAKKKEKRQIYLNITSSLSQLTFTCSMTSIETLEKGVKYVQS